MEDKKVILSLFDYSGRWPSFYNEGYDVYCIDIKRGIDILELSVDDLPSKVHGILAAPPCTDFAGSGAQYWKAKDLDGRTDKSLELIDKTLSLISHFKPAFWALENPVGRLPTLRPVLGKPWYFNPCDFAGYGYPEEAYTKKTGLWGNFNTPIKKPLPVSGPNPIMALGGKSERTKELRSMTPLGFSKAFFERNP